MSGELEAAGALATAGAVAGAIEGREPGKPGEGGCLNCGAALAGPFCSQCGQNAHPHRKLTHVFEEFLHGLVHFDTKAWRTLPMVAFRPGTLTRNYVYGKRARYISPIALFLFTIFLMFFVFAFMPERPAGEQDAPAASAAETVEELREDLTEARAELAEAEAEFAAGRATMPPLAQRAVDGSIQLLRDEVARLEARLGEAEAAETGEARDAETTPQALPEETAPAEGVTASPEESDAAIVAPVDERRTTSWQEVAREAAQSDDFVVVRGMDRLNEKFRQKLENPDYALYKIQQTAYKFSFLLAPLSLPFIALLFLWKRGVTFYDHMAYALYALSFASLLFVAIMLTALSPWTSWLTGWLIFPALPVHTYFHLKGAYALGWFSALWRTFFMLTFAFIILVIFLVLIIILGLTG